MTLKALGTGIQWIIATTLWVRKTDLWIHLFANANLNLYKCGRWTWGMQQHRSHNHCLLLQEWWQIKWHNLGQIISKRAPQCFTASIKHSHAGSDLSGCGRMYFTGCFSVVLCFSVISPQCNRRYDNRSAWTKLRQDGPCSLAVTESRQNEKMIGFSEKSEGGSARCSGKY